MSNQLLMNIHPDAKPKILLISDDINTAQVWRYALEQMNIDTTISNSPEEGLQVWSELIPDLVIIDIYTQLRWRQPCSPIT